MVTKLGMGGNCKLRTTCEPGGDDKIFCGSRMLIKRLEQQGGGKKRAVGTTKNSKENRWGGRLGGVVREEGELNGRARVKVETFPGSQSVEATIVGWAIIQAYLLRSGGGV